MACSGVLEARCAHVWTGVRLRAAKKFANEQARHCSLMESWNCIVVCRRTRGDHDEVLVQWESSWVDAEVAPEGEVVRVLMRRVVGAKHEMLVQWACTWQAVVDVDAIAVEEYPGPTFVVDEAEAAKAVKQSVVGGKKQKRAKRRDW